MKTKKLRIRKVEINHTPSNCLERKWHASFGFSGDSFSDYLGSVYAPTKKLAKERALVIIAALSKEA